MTTDRGPRSVASRDLLVDIKIHFTENIMFELKHSSVHFVSVLNI